MKKSKKEINNKKFVFESNENKIKNFKNKVSIKIVNKPKDFQDFYKVPWLIYNDDQNWVPPLWNEINNFFQKNNPFWNHTDTRLFLAKKNGKNVGRIAGFIEKNYCESISERISSLIYPPVIY